MLLTRPKDTMHPDPEAPRRRVPIGTGGGSPVLRLQPAPFPDPPTLIALIEQDPSLIGAGFHPAAREVPLPAAAGLPRAGLIGADAEGRLVAVVVVRTFDGAGLEAAHALRGWLEETAPTLRTLCPALARAGAGARCVVLAERVEPAATTFLRSAPAGFPEVMEVALFDTASGPAIWLSPAGAAARAARPAPAPPAEHATRPAVGATSPLTSSDPLAGIPLTVEEAAEFRRLSEAAPQRSEPQSSPHPARAWRHLIVEN